jgi:uncharacterized protein (TIGR03382 family)
MHNDAKPRWLLAACIGLPGPITDGGRYEVTIAGLRERADDVYSGDPMMIGSTFCLEIDRLIESAEGDALDFVCEDPSELLGRCFDVTHEPEGAVIEPPDGCYRVTSDATEWVWTATPRTTCTGVDALGDSFRLRFAEPAAVAVGWDDGRARLAEVDSLPGPAGEWPDDWIAAPSEPLRLLEGTGLMTRLEPTLYEPSTGERVALGANFSFLFDGLTPAGFVDEDMTALGYAVAAEDREIVAGLAEVPLDLFDTFDAATILLGSTAGVTAIAPEDAVSLEVIAVYEAPEEGSERPWGPPDQLRAIVRTADGHVIRGVPSTARVLDGFLDVSASHSDPGWHRASACGQAIYGTRRALVEVEAAGLVAQVDLEWMQQADDATLDPNLLIADCEGPGWNDAESGCGCSSGTGWDAAMLFLLPALFRRRRA